VSVQTLVGLAVVAVGVTGFLTFLVGRTLRQPALSGLEALRREPAEARTALAPSGKVFVHGELWNAWAAEPVGAGEPVEILGMQNLTLEVRAVRAQAPERNDRS
jgi:membrane-bound serine protease (ClpP class)